MKAVVVPDVVDGSINVTDVPVPEVGHGQALVKLEYSGVCHTDLHVAAGDFGEVPGRILGHEGIGIVTEVGEGVESLKPGDRVSIAWFFQGCGRLRILHLRQGDPVPYRQECGLHCGRCHE